MKDLKKVNTLLKNKDTQLIIEKLQKMNYTVMSLVYDIYGRDLIGVKQSLVSQILGKLKKYKIVQSVRNGTYISYHLNQENLGKIQEKIKNVNDDFINFINNLP